jgi:hypothetical protein
MTVMTKFYNWQSSKLDWSKPPYEAPSPALVSLDQFMRYIWGGANLGIEGDRAIRKGQSPSSHSFGAALDWRYEPHPSFPADFHWPEPHELEQVLAFLIDNSAELGVQAIHMRGRVWRAYRTRLQGGPGWKNQTTDEAGWLHIEVHKDWWADGRPVTEKIDFGPAVDPPVVNPPAQGGTYMHWLDTIRRTSNGNTVTILQSLLKSLGYSIQVDGAFGRQTEDGVKWFQGLRGLTIDGIVGPITWNALGSTGPLTAGGEQDAG